MTNKCICNIYKLEDESELFRGMTVEQLLYAAIKGSDYDEVKAVLVCTDWDKIKAKYEKQNDGIRKT